MLKIGVKIVLLILGLGLAAVTYSYNPEDKGILIIGVVTKVVGGDTIYLQLIDGKEEKVRLLGVDTPETKHPQRAVEPYGKEAAEYTEKHLSKKTIYLEKDIVERDRYGRLLAYIWLEPPKKFQDKEIRSKMFNARLLLDGYAQLMTIPPNVKYSEHFVIYPIANRR